MSDREKLAQIQKLAQLILDIRLVELERAARARQASLDHLADLNRPQPITVDNPVLAGEIAMRFQTWADQRRAAINLELAQQTVAWEAAKLDASQAFGRNSVLGKLRDRRR